MSPEFIKILVIDDSEDDWFLYRRALRSETGNEYVITEAKNGEDGLQHILTDEPACVLLDYSLPGRNGVEVLKRIRSKYPFVAVVMLTGQGNEEVAVQAIREGAQNYISKSSITRESLQRAVRLAIEHCAMEKRIREQRDSLEIFTRALAHDLKEPVRTIRSFLDLMEKQEVLSAKGKKYFDYVHQAAERMGGLIDTVYLYTRLGGAGRQVAQEKCDSEQALTDAKNNLTALIQERKAVVTNDPLPSVYINHMHCMQLLQNLVSNAIHHGTESPAIHISSKSQGEKWEFRVRDNGPGIDAVYQEKIFEPFKRLSGHKEQGLGLGLAICKKIVESCGGNIWCESVLDQGTDFCFTLPVSPAGIQGIVPTVVHSSEQVVGGREVSLATVMVVEDNEADIELMRIMLCEESRVQCNLCVAHDGREALGLLNDKIDKHEQIDLVLLDINMPGMDGFELLEHIKGTQMFNGIPVVMCSTSTYDKDISRAKELGAIGYMAKPAMFENLKPLLHLMPHLDLVQDEKGFTLCRAA